MPKKKLKKISNLDGKCNKQQKLNFECDSEKGKEQITRQISCHYDILSKSDAEEIFLLLSTIITGAQKISMHRQTCRKR